jgi:hypothetical protein
MPSISRFFGIVIYMYYDDHVPPHFHAIYGESRIQIDIETLEILEGELPRRALSLVIEWAVMHRNELRQNWQNARDGLPLLDIAPLE